MSSRASEIQLSPALLQLSPALEKVYVYNVTFKTKYSIVLACENIISRTSLYARPQKLLFSNVNLKYCKFGKDCVGLMFVSFSI